MVVATAGTAQGRRADTSADTEICAPGIARLARQAPARTPRYSDRGPAMDSHIRHSRSLPPGNMRAENHPASTVGIPPHPPTNCAVVPKPAACEAPRRPGSPGPDTSALTEVFPGNTVDMSFSSLSAATGEAHRVRPGRVLGVLCAGMFVVLLDVTIVNVALPSIGHGLRSDVSMLQWVVDGYVVAIAGLLLAGGTIGDRIGHRRVLIAGFAIFGVASLICATAPDVGVLIGARVVQGVGGALLLPSTMAVIVEAFPDRAEQARALGAWAAISSLALPAGPLLGGVLVGWLGWRPVFWINVPLTALTIAATLWTVPDRPGNRSRELDVPGLAGFVLDRTARTAEPTQPRPPTRPRHPGIGLFERTGESGRGW